MQDAKGDYSAISSPTYDKITIIKTKLCVAVVTLTNQNNENLMKKL